jgi:formylglycine-generating enzyme required for sulfatase activity
LTLKLAARLVKVAAEEAGPEGIRSLETGIVALVKGKSIEAQLYHRILDHIHDPEVKKLAHPGLILRKITANLIEEVLAGPCGIDVSRPGKAQELFDKLAKEIAVVENYESGVLMHRPDVRALTLRMLIEDQKMKDIAKEINEGAIRYYAIQEGSDARAEELYHLLLFDLDRSRAGPRAEDRAALGMLIRSIDELPARSQAFLAARVNIERSDRVWQSADLEDWELRTAQLAQECLAMHDAKQALSLISQRRGRTPDSPLYILEVDALLATEDTRGAAKKVDEFLSLPQNGPSTILDLGLRKARLSAIQNVRLSAEQARKIFEHVSGLPADLRLAEWLTLAIDAVSEELRPTLLADVRRVQREIPGDAWKGNEDLQRRVQDTLLRKPPTEHPDLIAYRLVEVKVTTAVLYRDDPNERHGPFVLTRGQHELDFPPRFRIGVYPVTNQQFLSFVNDDGYLDDDLWRGISSANFLTQDKKTRGPATWPSSDKHPSQRGNHPVAGVSYLEASAFVRWLNRRYLDPEWQWCLPSEDMWELTARSSEGFQYPWGSGFGLDHCNSLESGIKVTSDVERFPMGKSLFGCAEMAGNVWEFVEASDQFGSYECVLRGGSFRNNEYEVKSYLRLVKVPVDHRPPDFGLRCAQLSRLDVFGRQVPNLQVSGQASRSPIEVKTKQVRKKK